jgi:hypothetical protein
MTSTETDGRAEIAVDQRYRSRIFGDVWIVARHDPDRSCAWRIMSANPLGPSRWVTAGELRADWDIHADLASGVES